MFNIKLISFKFSADYPISSTVAHSDQPAPKANFRHYLVPLNFHDNHRYHTNFKNPAVRLGKGYCMGDILAAGWSLHGSYHGISLCVSVFFHHERVTSTRGSNTQPALVHEQENGVSAAAKDAPVRERRDGSFASDPPCHDHRHENVHTWGGKQRKSHVFFGSRSYDNARQEWKLGEYHRWTNDLNRLRPGMTTTNSSYFDWSRYAIIRK